ncbi:hypothetical protein ACIA98_41455 [Streptomyces sp. NPDC051366]
MRQYLANPGGGIKASDTDQRHRGGLVAEPARYGISYTSVPRARSS